MKYKNFEEYLQEVHMENYTGTDDDSPDAFENWVTNDLQVDQLIEHADYYAKLKVKEALTQEDVNDGVVAGFDTKNVMAPFDEIINSIKR